ncbi:hypothetical protein ACFV3R_06790 [Streptomyces sp. NPDC059740]|uniref:hypothetical protein n=1 Tax=Streptomyces sp. NPDC059740 TaxID=3346926 RepID=UPI00365CD34D
MRTNRTMPSRVRRGIRGGGAVLTAALLAAGVSACDDGKAHADKGAGKPSASAQQEQDGGQAVRAAYTAVNKVKSAHVHMTVSTGGSSSASGSMTLDGSLGWQPAAMDLKASGGVLDAAGGDSAGSRMIEADGVMYMDLGAKSGQETDGKRWMKFDLDALSKAGAQAPSSASSGAVRNLDQNPAKQLGVLVDSPEVKKVGEETVNGVQAVHYRGDIPVEQVLKDSKAFGGSDGAQRKKVLEAVKQAGIKDYKVDVWLNSDNLPVKTKVVMGAKKDTTTMTATYSDYSEKPVTPTLPPADQVLDPAHMDGAS